jgi:pimeloyl-ACP methyl ester carboxylesterase
MLRTIRLARWLGPWADSTRSPTVESVDEQIGTTKVRRYRRGLSDRVRARGRTFIIAPGLHYAGPDDVRMDRFCRILAHAGHDVYAPFISDYLALTPNRRAIDDFARVFDALDTHDKPVVFSISFGSLLAFALAAERGDAIDKLVIFGGYADFHETLRFCLTGDVASGRQANRDPLNQPVVLMNLLDLIDLERRSESGALHPGHERDERDQLVAAWKRYVARTWGRPEMKARERFVAIAEELAPDVPEAVRELFLVGIGARPGATDLALPALARFDASALDPAPYLPHITNRVELVHGVDDDVIPFEQSDALAARLVNADVRVHITGLYGHTGAQRPALTAFGKELITMIRVLRVLSA